MIRVAINGACGRMGRRLVEIVGEQDDMKIVAALEAKGHPMLGRDAGEVAGVGALGVPVSDELTVEGDVAIDFTAPESTVALARLCGERGMAAVIGTTGLEPDQVKVIEAAAGKVPVLFAPNMSVGVNVAFEAARMLAGALGDDYDVEIVETHHSLKKDAPSGTAKGFLRTIVEALGRDMDKDVLYGREGMVGQRRPGEIGVHAVRGGDVVGEHRVLFLTQGEQIELTHRATDRGIFARGAVRLARELLKRPPGLYGVLELLLKN